MAPTARRARPARAHEVVGDRDAEQDRRGREERERGVAHAVEPAADHRLQPHERGELKPGAGHDVDGEHGHGGSGDDRHRAEQERPTAPAAPVPRWPRRRADAGHDREHRCREAPPRDEVGEEGRGGHGGGDDAYPANDPQEPGPLLQRPEVAPPHHEHEHVDRELGVDDRVEEQAARASAPRARPGRSRRGPVAARAQPPRSCSRRGCAAPPPAELVRHLGARRGHERHGEVRRLDEPRLAGRGRLEGAAAEAWPLGGDQPQALGDACVGQAGDDEVGPGRGGLDDLLDPLVDLLDLGRARAGRAGLPLGHVGRVAHGAHVDEGDRSAAQGRGEAGAVERGIPGLGPRKAPPTPAPGPTDCTHTPWVARSSPSRPSWASNFLAAAALT